MGQSSGKYCNCQDTIPPPAAPEEEEEEAADRKKSGKNKDKTQLCKIEQVSAILEMLRYSLCKDSYAPIPQ